MTAPHALAMVLLGWAGAQLGPVHTTPGSHPPSASAFIAPVLGITPGRTVADALAEPFPGTYEVSIGKASPPLRKTLKNCTDYLRVRDERITTGSSIDDASLRELGVTCVALDWIRTATVASHPSFSDFSFRRVTAAQLPPALALSLSREQRAQVEAVSLKGGSILAVEPDLRVRRESSGSAELISPDWTATLTVYSHGDFVGDGQEELLVRWEGHAIGGTYKATSLFLLERHGDGLIVVRQYPQPAERTS